MGFRTAHNDGRRGRLRSYESLAGWVFADLLLVLFLVGLGSAIPIEPPEPPPVPGLTVFPEPKPDIVGMKTDPVKIDVVVDADALIAGDPRTQNQTRDLVRRGSSSLASDGDEAALVLIFGGGETASVGQRVAEAVYPQLHRAADGLFPRGMGRRYFWDGSLPYGAVRLEVFVFTTEESSDSP